MGQLLSVQEILNAVYNPSTNKLRITSGASGTPVTGPASSTDNAIARFDGAGGSTLQNSAVLIDDTDNVTGMASLTLTNTGLHLLDTDASHDLILKPGSNLTADRTLTITTGDADRTLTLSGNATISGTNTGDQTITLTGDVTGSGTGSFAATIANDAVTYAKIQNVSATDKLLGRSTAGAGDVEEITCTAAGRALIDDAAASNQRTTLGLGTIATQDANNVSITGGSITGITDLAVADGGTGASTLTANNVLLGNGTSAVQFVAPGSSGNVLTSDGSTWASTAPAGGGTARRNMNLSPVIVNATGAAPTQDIGGLKCTSAASIGAQSINKFEMNDVGNFDLYDKNPEFNFTLDMATTATGTGRYFAGDTGASLNPTSIQTTKSVFYLVDVIATVASAYLVNANGTTNTNTAVTGLTYTLENHIRIVKTSTTNIKLYANYTLKATSTTNLPSGDPNDPMWFCFGVTNGAADSNSRTLWCDYFDVLLDSPTG